MVLKLSDIRSHCITFVVLVNQNYKTVVCFAHVTNRMGNVEGDFEKGEANGSRDALQLIAVTAKTWLSASSHET